MARGESTLDFRSSPFPSENGPFSKSRRQATGFLVRRTAHAGSFGTSMPPAWHPFGRCARSLSTTPRKPLPSYNLSKNCSFPPRESRCPHPEFSDGNCAVPSGVSGWERARSSQRSFRMGTFQCSCSPAHASVIANRPAATSSPPSVTDAEKRAAEPRRPSRITSADME